MNSIQNGYTIWNHYAISKSPLPLPNYFSSWKTCVQQGWNFKRFVTYLNLHMTINLQGKFLTDFPRDCNKFSGPFSTDSSLALKVDQNVYHLRFLCHGAILLNHTIPIYPACIHPPGRPGKKVNTRYTTEKDIIAPQLATHNWRKLSTVKTSHTLYEVMGNNWCSTAYWPMGACSEFSGPILMHLRFIFKCNSIFLYVMNV